MIKTSRLLISIVQISLSFICFVITDINAKCNQHNITDFNKNEMYVILLTKTQFKENYGQYDFKDTIKSLRETYPEYFTQKIDTSCQFECIANLASIRATEKCRQSYIFLFNIVSVISDTSVLEKSVNIELWADYDAYYLMKYMGITDFGNGYHTSTNAWDYIPNKEVKIILKLDPKNRLLDATLIK